MIYKTISSKHVIAKIYRDLDLNDPNYELDFIEWFGEALNFIGSSTQLVKKQEKLLIEDHKANLPTDFVHLEQIRYESKQFGDNYLKYNPANHNTKEEGQIGKQKETYQLNPDVIVTTFEHGEITIIYKALPVDDDGYPLVPDNQYFLEALFWYAFKKMLMRGYKSKVSELSYFYADQQWKRYCTAARNKANYPDIGKYQRFADVWVGLIPAQRMFETGYNLNEPVRPELERVSASGIVTTPIQVQNENT